MPNANLLLAMRFAGVGYPTFEVWPDCEFPSAAGVNLAGWSRPVVDGSGHGIPSRSIGNVTWRALCTKSPGTSLYQADLWARWQNAGFAARREVGLIVAAKDVSNCFIARIRSQGTSSPEFRLFQVEGGVETQRGATTTHAGLSATAMNAGLKWRARKEDLPTGEIKITVYLSPTGAASKGTQIFTWSGAPGPCTGAYGVGIELHDLVSFDDVRVDDLEVYDTSDEFSISPAGGTGWTVRLGSTLYTPAQLEALTPSIKFSTVRQGFGMKGNSAHFGVNGSYRILPNMKPGTEVVCYHDGDVRFRGAIEDGSGETLPAAFTWNAYDGYFAARAIAIREDNGAPGLRFNVKDLDSEDYDPQRQGMTLGQIYKFMLDRYLSRLRFYGAAPPDGLPYVQAQIDLLTPVIPDVYLTGTLTAALETIQRYVGHKFQTWWNPETRVFELRDVTSATAETISFTSSWTIAQINPDRSKAYGAVEWVGALPEQLPSLELSVNGGGLQPVWTAQMSNKYGPEKRSKTILDVFILSAGSGVAPDGFTRDYVDVDAGLLDEDDIRGWVTAVGGYRRLVMNNTSTRIWLSDPRWAAPPAAGEHMTFDATDPDSLAELSAQGVGRGYYMQGSIVETGTTCSPSAGGGAGFNQQGFCGEAWTEELGANGQTKYGEQMQYKVRFPNQFQQAAGFCNPILTLSEKPRAYWFGAFLIQPKGSVPQGYCDQATTPDAAPPAINVKVKIPVTGDAPILRVPAGEDEFEGSAFTDWNGRLVYTVNDPDYISHDQDAGITLAAQMVLDVKKDKPFLLTVRRAANWHVTTPQLPIRATTSQFAGLTKRLQLTSSVATTGFESDEKLIVFSVEWGVFDNTETIECGSAAGWLEASGIDIAKGISEARILKRALTEVKRLEDFRNATLAKAADRTGGQLKGALQACQIPVSDTQTLEVTDVQKHDQKKVGNITQGAMREVLDASLMFGVEMDFPGNPISLPGRDGAAAQQVVDGPALRPLGDPLIPFQGPVPGPGGGLGYYGSAIVTDAKLSADPPDIVRRIGGLIFRKQADATGNRKGGPGLEYAVTDSIGNAAGGYTPYRKPQDLPNGRVPLKVIAAGSLADQLLKKANELARALGRVQDDLGDLLAPGTITAAYPDGVPADLASSLRAPGILAGFSLVPESFGDPGGPVWAGPKSSSGADSGTHWRVKAPEMLLVKVSSTPGAGANGGDWSLDTSGPGGSTPFATSAAIVHKQVHASDMSPDLSLAGIVALTPAQNAFGATLEGWCLNGAGGTVPGGVAGVIAVPDGCVGTPGVTLTVEEDLVRGAAPAVGAKYVVKVAYQYKASAWGASGAGATTPAPVAMGDGAGTGSGVYKSPISAVPPGLRAIAVSGQYTPTGGAGFAGLGKSMTVIGIGVDLAVIEGGYAILYSEGVDVSESWRNTMPFMLEVLSASDEWAIEFSKALAEGILIGETWAQQLNAPLEDFMRLDLEEEWSLELNGVPVFP